MDSVLGYVIFKPTQLYSIVELGFYIWFYTHKNPDCDFKEAKYAVSMLPKALIKRDLDN